MDGVIVGGPVATMSEGGERYGLVPDGAVAFTDGAIDWVGPAGELPSEYSGLALTDVGGRLVTPALVDCHTHIVFGGDRAGEFEMRLEGATYEEVARAGGGILSTMRATREADEDALLAAALPRVDHLIAEGVGTIEIKSGYGLSVADEMKMLRVARRIGEVRPVKVVTSWLAAHALPPDTDRARLSRRGGDRRPRQRARRGAGRRRRRLLRGDCLLRRRDGRASSSTRGPSAFPSNSTPSSSPTPAGRRWWRGAAASRPITWNF